MKNTSSTTIWYHVDDLGATPQVSDIILTAWEEGLINSVSIFGNGDALNDIKKRLSLRSDEPIRISVHLNISEGQALHDEKTRRFITDADNDLISGFGHILKAWLLSGPKNKAALCQAVYMEWDEQIKKVKETVYPRKIDALDGHIQVHMLPFLFPVTLSLAKKHGIPEIRITKERFFLSKNLKDSLNTETPLNLIKHLLLNFLTVKNRRMAEKNGVGTPEWYVSILYTGIMTKETALSGIEKVKALNGKSVEVVFHIGRSNDRETSRWKKNPGVGLFYQSPNRDSELKELARLHNR